MPKCLELRRLKPVETFIVLEAVNNSLDFNLFLLRKNEVLLDNCATHSDFRKAFARLLYDQRKVKDLQVRSEEGLEV